MVEDDSFGWTVPLHDPQLSENADNSQQNRGSVAPKQPKPLKKYVMSRILNKKACRLLAALDADVAQLLPEAVDGLRAGAARGIAERFRATFRSYLKNRNEAANNVKIPGKKPQFLL